MKKICKKCNVEKQLDQFNKHPKGHLGLDNRCRSCYKVILKENYKNKKQEYSVRNKNSKFDFKKHKYNIEKHEYNQLVEKQNGLCKICLNKRNLCVDHDHKTGKIRGLLCHKCNLAIGLLEDNISSMTNAIKYLS